MYSKIKLIGILLFILTCIQNANAGKYFDFSWYAKDAYQKTISLRFQEAQVSLFLLQQNEPDNLVSVFLENYVDFLTVFINDNETEYDRLSKNMDSRLSKIATGDQNSPYFHYIQAEIRLQWALLEGRYGEYVSSLTHIKQAYTLLNKNQTYFPNFVANKKSLGVMHALIGNVPAEYKWALKTIGGMKGTISQGIAEVEEVLNYAKKNDFIFEEETLVAYGFLLTHLNNQSEKAWKTLKNSKLNAKASPLAAYALANMALKTGRTDEAISYLESSPNGQAAYQYFHYHNYLLGLAKLYRLDSDAYQPLDAFVKNFSGQNAIKEAYQKLAWYHLVNGNDNGYRTYMAFVKTKGANQTDPDKAALREAKSNEPPDPRLLRARLLFDGGYYQRALDALNNVGQAYKNQARYQLEYQYRLGRIQHKLGKTDDAIKNYLQTIADGESQPWYFACNAALQLGILYEEQKLHANARVAYKRCLNIDPDEYASSLHAKAKAGLSRIKGK